MMKYVIYLPFPNLPQKTNPTAMTTIAWPQQVIKPAEATFYPNHSSLDEEIHRLLIADSRVRNANWGVGCSRDVMDEFRHNGKDFEYLSEEEEVPKPPARRRKNKKPLPTECVFCKNNGEVPSYYRNHILKDSDGKILCPILRNYECPICHAKGDDSHTLKYCPANPKPAGVPIVNALKCLRNASGKRRSKS